MFRTFLGGTRTFTICSEHLEDTILKLESAITTEEIIIREREAQTGNLLGNTLNKQPRLTMEEDCPKPERSTELRLAMEGLRKLIEARIEMMSTTGLFQDLQSLRRDTDLTTENCTLRKIEMMVTDPLDKTEVRWLIKEVLHLSKKLEEMRFRKLE